MANEQADNEDRTGEQAHEPRECMPCRGSGKLISNLGGSPSSVTCPWCEGGGVRVAGIDAQARWAGQAGESAADGATPPQGPDASAA